MRNLLSIALLAATFSLTIPAVAGEPPETHARRILGETPLVDGHNDWAYALRSIHDLDGAKTADLERPVTMQLPNGRAMTGHTSIPWLKQGMVGIQLWSVYVPASLAPADAVQTSFEQIDLVKGFAERYPDVFAIVHSADEAERAWKSGRIAGFLAMEGAHQIDDDPETLHRAWNAGVRSMTLAHSQPTKLFDSATAVPAHNGMASGGAGMIAEMNRLGMLVDLSHVSPAVMHAVLDIARAPVIFSHSGARAVTDHPRNVPDDVLRRVADNGGIVMATFVPAFVNQARADWEARRQAAASEAEATTDADTRIRAWMNANPRPVTTLAMVADHIDHLARVAGHDHVGLGGDFDGVFDLPKGLENVSTYPALFAELIRRGWSDGDLRKLAGGNFLRVLRANEAVARRLQQQE